MPTRDTLAYEGRVVIHFDEGRHFYTISIPELNRLKVYQPAVSTILGIKDKSGPLCWWTADQCKAYCIANTQELARVMNDCGPDELDAFLEKMKRNYKSVQQEAADIGKLAHDYLHRFLMWNHFGGAHPPRPRRHIDSGEISGALITKEVEEQANNAIDAGLRFYTEHEVAPLTLETPVWSPTHGFVGTDDFIGRIDGEKVVADYKTGKRIYPEVWLQTAAYQCAYQEQFPKEKLKARVAINIRKDGHLEYLRRDNADYYDADLKAFIHFREGWHWDRVHGYEPKREVELIGPLSPKSKRRTAKAFAG